MMKIFLSGGYSNLPREEATEWRQLIIKEMNENEYTFWIEVFDPTKLYEPTTPVDQSYEKEAMRYNLYNLKSSDIIIANLNKLDSIGTAQELMLAYTLDKPIIALIPEEELNNIHPWIKEEIFKFFTYTPDNLKEIIITLIDYIQRF